MLNKKGQVTLFIIIAVVIVAAVIFFLIFRDSILPKKIPSSVDPVYTTFMSCLENDVRQGISLLGSQGGYIIQPTFESGSAYMPFSNQLDFFGIGVPYWYYVSGNNIEKEQVPSKGDMENQLSRFIEQKIKDCNLAIYESQGFNIDIDKKNPRVVTRITKNSVEVDLDMDLSIEKGVDKYNTKKHNIKLNSALGKLYDNAVLIYNEEQKTLFLEEYGVDTLRLYVPVDGVEFSCAPKVWVALNVSETLKDALEANVQSLKVKGDYYQLNKEENKYFVVPVKTESGVNVRFLYSRNWPYGFEVAPNEDQLLIANPVGNQPGLGLLGFCYTTYHFVYDVKYPVLIQVMDESNGVEELFQFPMAVVIQGNQPRKPIEGSEALNLGEVDLCKYRNQEVEVKVIDKNLNSIDANIGFECFGVKCNIGETYNGELKEFFPQCGNGFVLAKADGYELGKYQISTNRENSASVILNKLYDLNVNLKIDGSSTSKNSIITFISENNAKTISYPEQKNVQLSEGNYEITVNVYDDSELNIGATTKEQCYEVPRGAVGGFFGLTKKECVDINFPEQTISQVLIGGGSTEYYILENELASSRTIEIDAESLIKPTSIEGVQTNYELFENKNLDVNLR